MKYILFLALGLASCYGKTPENLNSKAPELRDTLPMYLTKSDSVFIHNIICQVERTTEDSAKYWVASNQTIQLNIRLTDGVLRSYILNRQGTIDELVDINPDGSIIVYGEEGE